MLTRLFIVHRAWGALCAVQAARRCYEIRALSLCITQVSRSRCSAKCAWSILFGRLSNRGRIVGVAPRGREPLTDHALRQKLSSSTALEGTRLSHVLRQLKVHGPHRWQQMPTYVRTESPPSDLTHVSLLVEAGRVHPPVEGRAEPGHATQDCYRLSAPSRFLLDPTLAQAPA